MEIYDLLALLGQTDSGGSTVDSWGSNDLVNAYLLCSFQNCILTTLDYRLPARPLKGS